MILDLGWPRWPATLRNAWAFGIFQIIDLELGSQKLLSDGACQFTQLQAFEQRRQGIRTSCIQHINANPDSSSMCGLITLSEIARRQVPQMPHGSYGPEL